MHELRGDRDDVDFHRQVVLLLPVHEVSTCGAHVVHSVRRTQAVVDDVVRVELLVLTVCGALHARKSRPLRALPQPGRAVLGEQPAHQLVQVRLARPLARLSRDVDAMRLLEAHGRFGVEIAHDHAGVHRRRGRLDERHPDPLVELGALA